MNRVSKGAKSLLVGSVLACVLGAGAAITEPAHVAPEYAVVDKIPGDQSVAGWDHAAIDPATGQLFVSQVSSAAGSSGVTAVNLTSRGSIGQLVAVGMPHGIAVLGNGVAAVADATKNRVLFFDEKSGNVLAAVFTGKPPKPEDWKTPDVLSLEPKTGLLIVSNHDGGELALVDPKLHKKGDTIKIGGELEDIAAKGDGTVFVNVEDKGQIAVVDLHARKVVKRFTLKECEEPSGLAYDAADHIVISVCANGLAKFIDADHGAELASVAVSKGADGVLFDSRRKTVFVPGGDDGTLSIIHVSDRHHIALTQTLTTQPGTRLGAIDAGTGKVYLPTSRPDMKAEPLHLPGLPPIPPAEKGSFEYLVVAPKS
jgi:hypothetical protein